MNNELILAKAQAFDLLAAEQQKSQIMHQMLQQIALQLKVQSFQEIMPALQKLTPA
jgi:hypothetical protein